MTTALSGLRLLLVEDETLVAMMVEDMLADLGCRSVSAAATIDLVHDRTYRREADRPLEIPAGAVVVPGTRPVRSGPGREAGVSLYAPVIVKYRDEQTDTAVRLEELLR